MKVTNTLLATAAIVVLGASGAMAEGSVNTDGSHGAYNTQTDTNMRGNTSTNTSDTNTSSYNNQGATGTNTTSASADQTAGANMDAQTIQSVQASLRNEGHSVSVDGVWGPQTAAALRDFQRENSLSATGTLNAETLSALNLR